MKKVIKLSLLIALLALSACSTAKSAQTPEHTQSNYRVPPCHEKVHRAMLESQKSRLNEL